MLSDVKEIDPKSTYAPPDQQEKTPQWEYLGISEADGISQMQLDRDLLAEVRSGARTAPILRFYSWSPPAVSYGHNQQPEASIRMETARRLGYDVVQRPTGGRALLHKGDLCYAIIARSEWHAQFRTLSSTYRAISQAHRLALSEIGVAMSASAESPTRGATSATPCFAMLNPFEVTVRGRKICGSAQYRAQGAFLQHGSLRVNDNWTGSDLAELWPDGQALDSKSVTSIEAEIQEPLALSEFAKVWKAAFAELFQVEIRDG